MKFSADCPFNTEWESDTGLPVFPACDSLCPHTVSQGEFCVYWPPTGCTSEQQDHQAAAEAAARISLLNYSKPSSPLKRVKGPLLGWKNREYSWSRQQKVQLQMKGKRSPLLSPPFFPHLQWKWFILTSDFCPDSVVEMSRRFSQCQHGAKTIRTAGFSPFRFFLLLFFRSLS